MAKNTNDSCNWSTLYEALLVTILKKLSFIDILRFKAVCSYWLVVTKAYLASPSSYTHVHKTPWLLLPQEGEEHKNSFHFFVPEVKAVFKLENMPEEFCEGLCVGSCYEWLVFVDKRLKLYLFNPFSEAQIQLPSFASLPGVLNVSYFHKSGSDSGSDRYAIQYSYGETCYLSSIRELRGNFTVKAVLSSHPASCGHKSIGVLIIMYRFEGDGAINRTALCMLEDDIKWTELRGTGKYRNYDDIIFYNDQLYVLGSCGNIFVVEIWDLKNSVLVKTKEIEYFCPEKVLGIQMGYGCLCRRYIVEKSGNVLLVVRYFMDYCVEDLDYDGDCVQKTFLFHVFKLNLNLQTWEVVNSLGDYVLFLGGNSSLSISIKDIPLCFEGNSIYFTDEDWNPIDRMNKENLYDNFDWGVFNLTNGSIKDLLSVEPLVHHSFGCYS